ncbi:MAG: hypothetical protein IJR99_07565 [Kiritimatiellae bacterium]|nr:hypothetical protein [Kiritimatiellia bacterium]
MKETRCKKRGLIGVAVAVMFFFASWFAVLFFRDVGKTVSVLPPAPAVDAGTRRMRVRAVGGKGIRTDGEGARQKPRPADAPAAVRSVAGLDPETAGRFVPPSRALASLGRDLAREETDALLEYLLSPDGAMRPRRDQLRRTPLRRAAAAGESGLNGDVLFVTLAARSSRETGFGRDGLCPVRCVATTPSPSAFARTCRQC